MVAHLQRLGASLAGSAASAYDPQRGPSAEDLHAAKIKCVARYLVGPDINFRAHARILQSSETPGPDPRDNVVGVGIGDKVAENELTGERCIKIYVRQKRSATEISSENELPSTIDGIPTDIEEIGKILAFQQTSQRRNRLRPAPCGVSVGHIAITAGTIGALVRDNGWLGWIMGRRYILSNNHVLANSNHAKPGDPVVQPGPVDDPMIHGNHIGRLSRFVPLRFDGAENTVDCALATIRNGAVLRQVCAIGPIRGTTRARRNTPVVKHGRTTGKTRGIVTDIDADIRVDYGKADVAFFINTIVIRGVEPTGRFSDGGDSGSVILTEGRQACGLLFAGSENGFTFANPIQPVLRKLRVQLV